MNSFFSKDELKKIGLANYGDNVLLSRKASVYSPGEISIGSNVRIDDFCILSGNIAIGCYVHIAAYTALYGGTEGIVIKDFVNISSKNSIYAISDDYSGSSMTNPIVPDKYKIVDQRKVVIEKHVIIGTGCVILPGITLKEGSAFGAMSFINRSSDPWSINAGIPFKKIKSRCQNILKLEIEFLRDQEFYG